MLRSIAELVEEVAEVLELEGIGGTFTGGAILPLLVDEIVGSDLRPTFDVDVIVRADSYGEYHEACLAFQRQGFSPGGKPEDPLCRYRRGELVVDVMPTPYEGAGTDNPWFELGTRTARTIVLASGRGVQVVSAPVYLASKITAFRGRGEGDYTRAGRG